MIENIRKPADGNIGYRVFVDLQKTFTVDQQVLSAKLNQYVDFQMIDLNPACLIVIGVYT